MNFITYEMSKWIAPETGALQLKGYGFEMLFGFTWIRNTIGNSIPRETTRICPIIFSTF